MAPKRLLLPTGLVVAACAGGAPAPTPSLATSMEVEVTPMAVEVSLHVTNAGEAPVVFTFPSAQRHDFRILAESGEEVWRWSADLMFTQALVTDTLQPGETWRLEGRWEPGDRQGRFTAVGQLTARDTALEQRVSFDLP